jgi:Co/Zn/Cd efflux system component
MKQTIAKTIALALNVGAPLAATMTQFPIWVERSAEATVSGLFLFFALLSIVPLIKLFKRFLQSPSAPLMWGLIFIFLTALNSIISEMIIIAFVGMVSNIIGTFIYRKFAEKEEE